ncbi:MAG: ATP-binding protein [Polyangia bacterium]
MLKRVINYLRLPSEVTPFERAYLVRMNRIGLIFFFLHIPVFMAVAAACHTGVFAAFALTLAVLSGSTLAYFTFTNVRAMSGVFGFTAMCMGGLLVHFGQGPMQIEMHFYFFVLLALLAVFANPLAIIVASLTVAVHHLLLYVLLPSSIFNYDASLWTVTVHALFVVLEATAACFVARSFFDNVIGLERIVAQRTLELDARNSDLQLLLDTVGQGFLTVELDGTMSTERSAMVTRWFGDARPNERFWDYLGRTDTGFAASFRAGCEALQDDVLPMELLLDQLPKRMTCGHSTYAVGCKPILVQGAVAKLLVVLSDVTRQLDAEKSEEEQRESMEVFGRIMNDRSGFAEFIVESGTLVAQIVEARDHEALQVANALHTLKGNCGVFGLGRIATMCHLLEDRITDELRVPTTAAREELALQWNARVEKITALLGERNNGTIELVAAEYEALKRAADRAAPRDEMMALLARLELEPTEKRLARIAEQTRALGQRLHKRVDVRVESNSLRLDPTRWSGFWSSFIHMVRNAVDHGLDNAEERLRASKPSVGTIKLSTYTEGDAFVIEIVDDGRGIDWLRVEERARSRGLPHESRAELVEALFADGLSTNDEITELSGRGIGLGAVRRECDRRGGTMVVESERGQGTKLQCRFALETTRKAAPRMEHTAGAQLMGGA